MIAINHTVTPVTRPVVKAPVVAPAARARGADELVAPQTPEAYRNYVVMLVGYARAAYDDYQAITAKPGASQAEKDAAGAALDLRATQVSLMYTYGKEHQDAWRGGFFQAGFDVEAFWREQGAGLPAELVKRLQLPAAAEPKDPDAATCEKVLQLAIDGVSVGEQIMGMNAGEAFRIDQAQHARVTKLLEIAQVVQARRKVAPDPFYDQLLGIIDTAAAASKVASENGASRTNNFKANSAALREIRSLCRTRLGIHIGPIQAVKERFEHY